VIGTAPDAYRVFLGKPQPRQRLPRIHDGSPGTGDELDVAASRRRDGRERLQEIETRALAGEQRAGIARKLADGSAFVDRSALRHEPFHDCVRIEIREAQVEPGLAADHGLLPADHRGAGSLVLRRKHCRPVSRPDIFGQRRRDVAFDFALQIHVPGAFIPGPA